MTDQLTAKQVSKNLLHLEQYDWPHLSVAVCGKPALREEVIKRLAELLYKEGATCWTDSRAARSAEAARICTPTATETASDSA